MRANVRTSRRLQVRYACRPDPDAVRKVYHFCYVPSVPNLSRAGVGGGVGMGFDGAGADASGVDGVGY